MAQPTPLHHVNGGDPALGVQCANCNSWLGNERAIAHTDQGVKYFCKMEPGDNPQDSCYLQWCVKHPQPRRH